LKYSPVHGNGGSPILVGNALIFSADGQSDPSVIALDKATGKLLWKVKRETTAKKNFSFSTPTLITVNGQAQLITPGSGVVCALNPKTGAELWRCRYGEGYSVIPKPVLGHGLLRGLLPFDRHVLVVSGRASFEIMQKALAARVPVVAAVSAFLAQRAVARGVMGVRLPGYAPFAMSLFVIVSFIGIVAYRMWLQPLLAAWFGLV